MLDVFRGFALTWVLFGLYFGLAVIVGELGCCRLLVWVLLWIYDLECCYFRCGLIVGVYACLVLC